MPPARTSQDRHLPWRLASDGNGRVQKGLSSVRAGSHACHIRSCSILPRPSCTRIEVSCRSSNVVVTGDTGLCVGSRRRSHPLSRPNVREGRDQAMRSLCAYHAGQATPSVSSLIIGRRSLFLFPRLALGRLVECSSLALGGALLWPLSDDVRPGVGDRQDGR